MSEHAEHAPVPFFADGLSDQVALPREAASPAVGERGRDWPLATVFFGGVGASYAVVVAAIYEVLTALF